jgi:hypothetical protein
MKLFEPEKKGFSFDIKQNAEQNEIMRKGTKGTNENIYTYSPLVFVFLTKTIIPQGGRYVYYKFFISPLTQ